MERADSAHPGRFRAPGVRPAIWRMAKNDMKARYAGSHLGLFWALFMPAATVAIYCFVFQVGFRAAPVETGAPYALWLISGIIPWFFFVDAWTGASNSLCEYSYLVKKVVFPIEALPIIKIISAALFHAIFICIATALFIFMGQPLTVYSLQLPYYTLCLCAFLAAIGYLSAAITPFFRDFGQFVQIACQLGFWLTPIGWQAETTVKSPALLTLLKANPMHYIVEGYRNSLIGGEWFFERPFFALYFWGLTALCLGLGATLFGRMRQQFADVL